MAVVTSPRGIFIALAGMFTNLGVISGAWVARLPTLKEKLALSSTDVGLALFCAAIGAIIGIRASGSVIGKLGSRQVTGWCALCFAILLSAIALAPTLIILGATLAALGFFIAVFDIAINGASVRHEADVGRAVLSRLHGFFSLGLALGAMSGAGAESAGLGLAPHFIAVAVLIGGTIALASRSLKDSTGSTSGGSSSVPWNAPMLVLTALAMAAFLAEGVSVDWAAILVTEERGGSKAAAAAAVATFAASMTVARFASDWVTERIGRQTIVLIGACIALIGLCVVALVNTPSLTSFGLMIVGIGLAPVLPGIMGLAGNFHGGRPEDGVARIAGLTYVIFLIGPALTGWAADQIGLAPIFGLCAFALALTATTFRQTLSPPKAGKTERRW
jgi:fucose permease